MAPRVGFEPTTSRLTVGCSTTELPRNSCSGGGPIAAAFLIVQREMSANSVQFIDDPADPRVAAFRDIRERDLTGREGLFVAEGEVVIRTLLAPESLCRARSLLIADNRVEAQSALIASAGDTPVYSASQSVMDAIAGFPLHRGLLALGEKPVERTVEETLADLPEDCLVLAAAGIGNHDNMGGLFRNAAAFGAAAVLRDERDRKSVV